MLNRIACLQFKSTQCLSSIYELFTDHPCKTDFHSFHFDRSVLWWILEERRNRNTCALVFASGVEVALLPCKHVLLRSLNKGNYFIKEEAAEQKQEEEEEEEQKLCAEIGLMMQVKLQWCRSPKVRRIMWDWFETPPGLAEFKSSH